MLQIASNKSQISVRNNSIGSNLEVLEIIQKLIQKNGEKLVGKIQNLFTTETFFNKLSDFYSFKPIRCRRMPLGLNWSGHLFKAETIS